SPQIQLQLQPTTREMPAAVAFPVVGVRGWSSANQLQPAIARADDANDAACGSNPARETTCWRGVAMTTVPAKLGSHGHFLPGVSGNPGGRTSALTEVRALLKPHVELYVARLNELVRHPDPDVALPALREALDRLLGKPVASIEQDVRTLDIGQLYLAAV